MPMPAALTVLLERRNRVMVAGVGAALVAALAGVVLLFDIDFPGTDRSDREVFCVVTDQSAELRGVEPGIVVASEGSCLPGEFETSDDP